MILHASDSSALLPLSSSATRRAKEDSNARMPPDIVQENEDSVDALTFGKAHIVASVEGKSMPNKAPKDNWRYAELLVDSGAVDNVGDPKSFPEYRLRESEGSRRGCIIWQQT